jgi:hypothetical protein
MDEVAAKRQSLSEQDPLRQVPGLTVEEARRQLYELASGLVRLRKPAGSLLGRARLVGPHRRGGLLLVPEIDASATLDRLERLTRESTELHGELEALGIVVLALQRLGQPAAIERLIPLDELVRTFARDQQLETSSRFPCWVLAGVTAGGAISSYGV